jgi:hypothetical protein
MAEGRRKKESVLKEGEIQGLINLLFSPSQHPILLFCLLFLAA